MAASIAARRRAASNGLSIYRAKPASLMRRWSALLARPDTAMTGWCAYPFQIAQRVEELEAVHARHPEIADDQIDALAHQRLERLDSVLRRQDIGAKPFEHHASRLARVFDVLDHENPEAIQPLQAARPRARPVLAPPLQSLQREEAEWSLLCQGRVPRWRPSRCPCAPPPAF